MKKFRSGNCWGRSVSMERVRVWAGAAFFVLICTLPMAAQQQTTTVVPTLVKFSGILDDAKGEPLAGTVGVTFALYPSQQGGSPVWLETQNVQADKSGHYTVMLGSTTSDGLPANLFASGEARWVGVQVQGQPEQPRVLLLSVPYAMKAGDADTLGGLPASAYRTVNSGSGTQAGAAPPANGKQAGNKALAQPNTITGKQNYVAKFTDTKNDLGDSEIYDTGKAVGIGTTTPGAFFDVHATTTGVHDPEAQVGSSGKTDSNSIKVYNGSDLIDIFLSGFKNGFMPGTSPGDGGWRVDPGHNLFFGDKNLSRLVLLSNGNAGIGTTTPAYTLDVEGTGIINAAKSYNLGGQPFAYSSNGNTNVFLGFAGNATVAVTGNNNTASGVQALYSDTTGSWNTADGYDALYSNTTGTGNTVSGTWALKSNTAGGANTASGLLALGGNTQGNYNTASGYSALVYNSTGSFNTASGVQVLPNNTTGGGNTASGYQALPYNTTGGGNTAIGLSAGLTLDFSNMTASNNTFLGTDSGVSTGTLTNATAIGYNAVVSESNALVLGSTTGVLGGTSVNVGISTTAPTQRLEVDLGNVLVRGADNFQNSGDTAQLFLGNTNNFIQAQNGLGVTIGVTSQSSALSIVNGGNVGIGTTSPDNLLSVNGSADKPGGGSWGTFSDRRLKTLDGSFNAGLSQILKINPVRYRYKADNAMGIRDQEEHVGLVAQEVQKVIPEAVTENGKGYLLVNNDPIIWTMLNAIKEQQELIQKQQERIGQLTSQVKAIQASLKTNGRTGTEIRTVKARAPMVQQ